MNELSQALPGSGNFFNTPQKAEANKQLALSAAEGRGLEIKAGFLRAQGKITLEMSLTNQSQVPLTEFLLQFNVNTFQLRPSATIDISGLMPGQTAEYSLAIDAQGSASQTVSDLVPAAIKTNVGVSYFNIPVLLHILFVEGGRLDKTQYLTMWKTVAQEQYRTIGNLITQDTNLLQQRLEAHNIFFIASRKLEGQLVMYMSALTSNNIIFLLELSFGNNECKLCSKTQAVVLIPLVEQSIEFLLTR